ncbi:PulJ/GspJ family protein [Bradyrhizobium betae]|uniref:General secretion pathway protein GspJ n=1 Tax=Bradyrhizobium betae TaxID=244734 RepID=A0A4Q1UQN0_9BRAD|nr:prepilin-type N-terminal cleavage/methylation domain-containing protein [Bradyrhizobium betae]RXT36450.1 general secretion pathway protein GspJ [Bradyrhizobium betae]
MIRPDVRTRRSQRGFTLLEALIALALMGLIMGALVSVTAQWLPSWNRGIIRAQRNEQVAIALDRLVADLSAADYVGSGRSIGPLFRGEAQGVIFIRSVVGPNGRPGLEIVRIAEMTDSRGALLVRTRAPFAVLPNGDPLVDSVPFGDPVVLLRAPFRVGFSYAGADGKWESKWPTGELPASVRFEVRDIERGTVMSTAARIHVDMSAPRPDPSNQPETARAQPVSGLMR